MTNNTYQQDTYPDDPLWRRDDFERWAIQYWTHLIDGPVDLTRQADAYQNPELRRYWECWRMHVNWLTWGEGGDDQGRAHMRDMVGAHVEQFIKSAAHTRPSEYALGYLHAQIITYAMCGVITKTAWDDWQDQLDELGLGSRMFRENR